MRKGLPSESSFSEHRSIHDVLQEIRDVYQRYPQPWVLGYSGGKDSTAVLQLVWRALEVLPEDQRQKPVYVISSDTLVEAPLLVDHIDRNIALIERAARDARMPFVPAKVKPVLNDTFWVNLIGRGYPAPSSKFRWCTERLKINPADRFVEEKVAEHTEVIMILGVRKTESATRMQLLNSYMVNDHVLRRHSSLHGAYLYSPIVDFSTDDVWSYLLQNASPWGADNRQLSAMYRNATSAGECPLVVDDSTPSCGQSRFGCWVCTVVERDRSMDALIENGDGDNDWLQHLADFRTFLRETTDPARKHIYRDFRGRNGRVIYLKDGTLGARTYRLDTSREMLRRLLEIQENIRREGPPEPITLVSDEELHEIRRLWRTERQDWEDSVPTIVRDVTGRDLAWPTNDDGHFDADHRALLESLCDEHGVPFDLMARLLEVERRSSGVTRRAGVVKELGEVLEREWRAEEELLAVSRARAEGALYPVAAAAIEEEAARRDTQKARA
ncbi:DNA phosphorothioation system sulfurtransferase DndC [Deinococcus yavapaiensis]|uniref:DNA sulfur modification protein DndC n=1 Tax=Deinococcus yavapaiensis KR-236 TaxID=694435 RepID=A0A318S5M2_9DEIO|nr:DNA phosphorothioation system sulfurtransferase DndC [Deinococcus yavapaiensis]PYE54082.1 DNA sulfur modification protein DndC [Deinococcus yavapaiensis KR-236]